MRAQCLVLTDHSGFASVGTDRRIVLWNRRGHALAVLNLDAYEDGMCSACRCVRG
jgi:hypothetical protein